MGAYTRETLEAVERLTLGNLDDALHDRALRTQVPEQSLEPRT
jgi:hypothetical protein